MNLWFRLLRILLFSRFQSPLDYFAKCQTTFRVWPSDLDLLRHMNNGKYFTLMDLARVNLLIRSGMAKTMKKHGFYPVISAESMRFKKSLKVFQAFEIQSQVLAWDDKNFYLEQFFIRNNEVHAHAFIKARILHKNGDKVSPADCMKAAGKNMESPEFSEVLKQFVANTEEL